MEKYHILIKNLYKILYKNVKSASNIIDFHRVFKISLMSNEKELERIKFTYLSKLRNFTPSFSWDMVPTYSHDPQKVTFNFSSHDLTSSEKDFLSRRFRFVIPHGQIDHSGCLAEYQLLYRSTKDLSMTSEDRKRFKAKLKNIALSCYKFLNNNCKYESNLSSKDLSSSKTLIRNIVIQKN